MSKNVAQSQVMTVDLGVRQTNLIQRVSTANRLAIVLVLALTFAAYISSINYKFVYDDKGQIVENQLIRSWAFAPHYFTEHVWTHKEANSIGNYYRPVFMIWMLLNYMLFGLNASWWHLTTILVHVAVTFMVYLLARRLLKDQWTAGMTALIFGLHPVHIEAVSWVSGVTEPLLALFLIPAFLFYLNWRESSSSNGNATFESSDGPDKSTVPVLKRNRRLWLAASLVMYALALFEKETALALPALIFVYEWVYGSHASFAGRVRNGIKLMLPYIALSAAYLPARFYALNGIGHAITPLPLSTIALTWPSLLWFYIKMLIWPTGLSAFYDTPYVVAPGLVNFTLPLFAVVAVAAFLLIWARKSPVVAFACALLVVPLLPLLNLSVFFPGEIAHDRYLYLPSIGFSILAALALKRLSFGQVKLFGQPVFQVLAAIALAAFLVLATTIQQAHWASDLLLFYRGVSVAPNNDIAKNNLANEMVDREMYDEAVILYQQVIDHDPGYWRASYNLGYVYYKVGRYAEAEQYLARSIELNKSDADQFTRLAVVLMKLGRLDEAIGLLRHAIEMRPDAPGYHYTLGMVLKQKGDREGAIGEFEAELANNTNHEAASRQIAELKSRQ